MGWWFCAPTRDALVKDIVKDYEKDGNLIGQWSTCYGKRLWLAFKSPSAPECTGIALFLLDKSRHSSPGFKWGYKSMSEDMHPYYYDCPLEALNATNAFNGNKLALEWREKVIGSHKAKRDRRIAKYARC
jgi:hypothetical protein